jgi:hypothetical protein
LIEIRDNLADRIAEAQREGWLGEVEGLSISLAAAEEKRSKRRCRALANQQLRNWTAESPMESALAGDVLRQPTTRRLAHPDRAP